MRAHPDLFWVRVENSERVARLRLIGRLDTAALPYLGDKVDDAQGRDVVLDLGEVTFADGAALIAVRTYDQQVQGWGRHLRLERAAGAVRQLFESPETRHLLTGGGRR
jgi:anti-anti-sigma factor